MAQELSGKVAVVTGGASGIGRAMVELFVAEGARVVIADINAAQGSALAQALGVNAAFCATDVSQREQVEAAVDFAVARFGGLDVMCNNAGFPGRATPRFLDDDLQDYERIFAINLMGVVFGSQCAARRMAGAGGGSIINTASVAGVLPGFGFTGYRASKAAVINFTRSIAIDLAAYAIRVNALVPGSIKTPITDYREPGMADDEAAVVRAATDAVMRSYQPLQRQGRPEDVAEAALFLASDRSRQITGILLPVEGGITAGDPVNHAEDLLAARQDAIARVRAGAR